MAAIVDIETDGFKNEATQIHCIVAKCPKTNTIKHWVQEECKDFKDWSKSIDTFVMHNGLSFDAPLLNKFTGSSIESNQIRDTLIESQLFNPIREEGHGLNAWGKKDRKSTRLNSSHGYISYAVFCLKKKKTGGARTAAQRRTPRRGRTMAATARAHAN